jgi:hypothetical protein
VRWVVVDAGMTGRLNDVIEDAGGRWWIAGDGVRVSEDRGKSWRVALDKWTRSLAVDGDAIWAGGSSLFRTVDGVAWSEHGRWSETIDGIVRANDWLYCVTTYDNQKADVARGTVQRSRGTVQRSRRGDDWDVVYAIDYGYPGLVLAWGDEVLVHDYNYAHRFAHGSWTSESLPQRLYFWRDTAETITACDSANRIWRSTDRGRTWRQGDVEPELTRLSRVSRCRDGSWLAVGGENVVMQSIDD